MIRRAAWAAVCVAAGVGIGSISFVQGAYIPSGGGGTDCSGGGSGIAGQICESTGGAGAAWGQSIIGAPGITSGQVGTTVSITSGAGEASGFGDGGDVNITSGVGNTSGFVTITSGDILTGGRATGGVTLVTHDNTDATSRGDSGSLTIGSGAASIDAGGSSGASAFTTGSGYQSGNITIATGAATPDHFNGSDIGSGQITLSTGNSATSDMSSSADSGGITLKTGTADPGSSTGSVVVRSSAPTGGGTAGGITLASGINSPIVGANAIRLDALGDLSLTAGYAGTQADDIVLSVSNPASSDPAGRVRVANGPHLLWGGNSKNPAVSSCGTGGTLTSGSDTAGIITAGTGTANSCTLTFYNHFDNSPGPACMASVYDVTAGSAIAAGVSAISVTSVTLAFSADAASKRIAYWCVEVAS